MGNTVTKIEKKKPVRMIHHKYYDFAVGPIMWQEKIKAARGTDSTMMDTQMFGVRAALTYNKFFSSTWRQSHALEFSFGTIKGKSNTATIPDGIKNQKFEMIGVTPGLAVRTSPISEFGAGIPLAFRFTQWKFESGSGFSMDKGTTFSAGISAFYANRFTPHSALQIIISHQHMWNTTLWAAAYDYAF